MKEFMGMPVSQVALLGTTLEILAVVLVASELLVILWRVILRWRALCPDPPRNARFLIMLFIANPSGDAVLGDLEERFYRIANDPAQGPGRARFWYWFQVMISLRPLGWAFLKRVSGLAALYEAIRKVIK